MAKLSSAELAKREELIMQMKKNKRNLVKKYGSEAEKVMYGRATNIAKKLAEQNMENTRLREMVKAALSNPNEDLDIGHEDNEPHMLKADLYRIGKYAMELYQMIDGFEGKGEVDFPSWFQAKITKSVAELISAKHWLDFETKEPQIDAMVGVEIDIEESHDGDSSDVASMARSSQDLRNKTQTRDLAKKAAEQSKDTKEASVVAVKLAKASGITDSEQITHIADLATKIAQQLKAK